MTNEKPSGDHTYLPEPPVEETFLVVGPKATGGTGNIVVDQFVSKPLWPIVAIGMGVTVYALVNGIRLMRKKDDGIRNILRQQAMMRLRVGAQAGTIFILIASAFFSTKMQPSKTETKVVK